MRPNAILSHSFIDLIKGIFLLCFVVFGLTSCASLLKPKLKQEIAQIKAGNYQLDKDHAAILFKVDHLGFSKFIGRFNSFDASLVFDSENIENSTLEAIVDMTSVDVNNKKFERALKGRFWFDSENFPQAYFKTTSARRIDEKNIEFYGDVTFLGVTKPITLYVHVNGAATNLLTRKYTLGFSAKASIIRSEFGLDRYVPSIGDDIELEIHAEFQRGSKKMNQNNRQNNN